MARNHCRKQGCVLIEAVDVGGLVPGMKIAINQLVDLFFAQALCAGALK
ncbi:MAG: hypothetical protein GY802_07725 [Gammaproteobacteria bacterium]|nr:hypothetical protein [Gammaproteobacteria bacterium]MCP5090309.1 hypothetical protein [Gammaproteobacteria bacterium]